MEPAARAGRMISAMDWARSANMRDISAAGAMGPTEASDFESSRTLRMRSPRAVPPGLRRVTTLWPLASSVAARRRIWVVFPEPSRPSKVMKYPRGITFSLSRATVYPAGSDGIATIAKGLWREGCYVDGRGYLDCFRAACAGWRVRL